jgi:hypothetical protein
MHLSLSDADLRALDILGWTPTNHPSLQYMLQASTADFKGVSDEYTFSLETDADGNSHVHVADQGNAGDGAQDLINFQFLRFQDKIVYVEDKDGTDLALLYNAALGRAPDPTGLAAWKAAYSDPTFDQAKTQGVYASLAETSFHGLPSIADGFLLSPEFQQKYGALDNANFVTQLYANVLDRAPDAAGLHGWLDAMDNGTTREAVLVGFAESNENIAKAHADWLITT